MKRVGIVSCYFKTNYGSMLQAYATQRILDRWGIDNETIDISGFNAEIRRGKGRYYARNLFNMPMYQAKKGFVRHILHRKTNAEFGANIRTRRQAFTRFQQAQFRLSAPCPSKAALADACAGAYTDVLVGSDQLWLPLNIAADYYTLSFVPDGINTVAYATSFGVSALPRYQRAASARFLNRITHISVREQSGQRIVRELTGREVPVVCDPTLLFTGEDWREIQPDGPLVDGPYIFCYFLGRNAAHRAFANRLKEATGYPIVVLRHLDEYIPADDAFGDSAPYDVGPAEFLGLIRHAAYVCTDSFHGTVFSILHDKAFFSFRRFAKANAQSTNTRVESLLGLLGLEGRLLTGEEEPRALLERPIDTARVRERLDDMRTESMAFLREALGVREDLDHD